MEIKNKPSLFLFFSQPLKNPSFEKAKNIGFLENGKNKKQGTFNSMKNKRKDIIYDRHTD